MSPGFRRSHAVLMPSFRAPHPNCILGPSNPHRHFRIRQLAKQCEFGFLPANVLLVMSAQEPTQLHLERPLPTSLDQFTR
jgi:hypothetical protein